MYGQHIFKMHSFRTPVDFFYSNINSEAQESSSNYLLTFIAYKTSLCLYDLMTSYLCQQLPIEQHTRANNTVCFNKGKQPRLNLMHNINWYSRSMPVRSSI